jgi:hypothetical protein
MRPSTVKNAKRVIEVMTLMAFILGLAGFPGAQAQTAGFDPAAVRATATASGLDSLATVPTPPVDLSAFLKPGPAAQDAVVRLGKALFWDMQAGSDGQACASCHFHAGADNRARNQLSPGLRAVPEDTFFGNNFLGVPGFPQFQPDYALVATNFPFHVLADP